MAVIPCAHSWHSKTRKVDTATWTWSVMVGYACWSASTFTTVSFVCYLSLSWTKRLPSSCRRAEVWRVKLCPLVQIQGSYVMTEVFSMTHLITCTCRWVITLCVMCHWRCLLFGYVDVWEAFAWKVIFIVGCAQWSTIHPVFLPLHCIVFLLTVVVS